MRKKVDVVDGDWVVVIGRYRPELRHVVRATDKTFTYKAEYSERLFRQNNTGVVFAGPEAVARSLAEKLIASCDQCAAERSAASQNRIARDDALIAGAA